MPGVQRSVISPRDVLEASWHLGLLVFVWPPFLRYLLAHRAARALGALVIIAALVYHCVVAYGCHVNPYLCA